MYYLSEWSNLIVNKSFYHDISAVEYLTVTYPNSFSTSVPLSKSKNTTETHLTIVHTALSDNYISTITQNVLFVLQCGL